MRATLHKNKLVVPARRLRSEIDAIERAPGRTPICGEVMRLIAGARGAMAGLIAEVEGFRSTIRRR